MAVNLALFALSLLVLGLWIPRVLGSLRAMGQPLLPSGLVLGASLLYASALLPGAAGHLTPAAVCGTLALLASASARALAAMAARFPSPPPPPEAEEDGRPRRMAAPLAAALAA